ncbi:ribosome-recycling factor [Microbulbifer agarilyticus]|uniref:hypothetical protein n=1 Tax=Microbulbifer agarilyticus TaxID=260552 RepID=UPI001C958317|nr:hypothetical protein [Microbulbifer agarilyticus]MBY6190379.1 hypothetical protein [Microbulbifer agarilyticus]MBY6210376.1 hypothetical protein [Microbulbifer agarilyticus]MCA0892865.1 hypothetical protein [Microbulbifer agarilyticus]
MPRKSHHPFWSSLCAALVALLLFAVVNTGKAGDDDTLGPDFWEKYDDIADWTTLRLNLTPEQEDKVLPILERNFELQLTILKDYGFGKGKLPKLTREQREELDAKIIATRAATRVEMVKVLNKEQLEELKKMQTEFHQEFRKRLDKKTKE